LVRRLQVVCGIKSFVPKPMTVRKTPLHKFISHEHRMYKLHSLFHISVQVGPTLNSSEGPTTGEQNKYRGIGMF
jgi:hypothetical protein